MEQTELIPASVSEKDVRDEANKRLARAGYCSRSGERLNRTKIMLAPPTKQYEENYVRCFGHD